MVSRSNDLRPSIYLLSNYVCMCVCVRVLNTHGGQWIGSLWELVLFLHHLVPGIEPRSSDLAAITFTCELSCQPQPCLFLRMPVVYHI